MTKTIITLAICSTIIGCSNNNSKPAENSSNTEVSSTSTGLDKEAIRKKAMDYCQKNNDAVFFDYFRAYNAEFVNTKVQHEFGAFQDFNLITDSLDDQFKKNPKKLLQAETSVIISNSQDIYKVDKTLGKLHIVGLQFDLNNEGQITGHREYLIFWNDNKKSGDKTTAIYPKDAKKEGSYNYLKTK